MATIHTRTMMAACMLCHTGPERCPHRPVHVECIAEARRRMRAGECMVCARRQPKDGHVTCRECSNRFTVRGSPLGARGYPGPPGTVQRLGP